jgi:hypothetical protein
MLLLPLGKEEWRSLFGIEGKGFGSRARRVLAIVLVGCPLHLMCLKSPILAHLYCYIPVELVILPQHLHVR